MRFRSREFYERFEQYVSDGANSQAPRNTSPVRFVAADAMGTEPRPVADTTDQEVSGEAPSSSLGPSGEPAPGSSAR